MATSVNPPRGMRDFLPAEKARREHALGVIRSVYSAHGFDEIETPVVEDFERLHSGLGGDNEKLAFSVLKRGLDATALAHAADSGDQSGLTDLGLRFDLTVPLARFYATHRAELPPVFRSIQIAPVWRAERPQKGRYRQFVQCDIDIIGEAGPLAEVELITATAAALRTLGLSGTRVRINDRRVLLGLLESFGFAAGEHAQVLITIDKLDKIGAEGVVAELRERSASTEAVEAFGAYLTARVADAGAGGSSAGAAETTTSVFGLESIQREVPAGVAPEALQSLADIGAAVQQADAAAVLVFDPFLVRGMGYYTGTIFEIEHPDFGYSLGGGGRYDGMIGRFLGQDVPAAGFSIGFERIVDLVEADASSAADQVVLVHDADAQPAQLALLKTALVAAGKRVRLERRTKNLKATLDRVEAAGFGAFAFVGRDTSTVDQLEFKPLG
jgi:histidyl-tRNA synthetase